MASPQKIALYGGTFDPVHCGHLLVAQSAMEELELDRLFFIPASQSPFKPERLISSAGERLKWLRLALQGCPRYEVDQQEILRGGFSFAIDTVRDYARRFPETLIHFVVGADHVTHLGKWRESTELARLVVFCVIPRPGESAPSIPEGFRLHFLKGFPFQISASQIRDRIQAGLSVRNLVPPAVEESIRNSGLYL